MTTETILLLAMAVIITFFTCTIGMIWFTRKHNNSKPKSTTSNAVDQGIKQMQDVYTQMITDLKTEKKSLQATVNRYKGLVETDDEGDEADSPQPLSPLIAQFAEAKGIPKELLELPEIQKLIKKHGDKLIPLLTKARSETTQPDTNPQNALKYYA